MNALKLVALTFIFLVAVALVLVFFSLVYLDDMIKWAVEKEGSNLAQTEVRLESAHFDLKTRQGQLSGLTIANPPGMGYKSSHAFQLDNITVGVDLNTLLEPVVVITNLTIDGAKLVTEQLGPKTNLTELRDKIEQSSKASGAVETPTGEEAAASNVRLMLEEFAFINASATIISEELGEKSLQVPDIRLSNIGNREDGLTPDQLANDVLRRVIRQVKKATREKLGKIAEQALEEKYQPKKKLREKFKDKLESLFNRGD
jgi:hypothetical protein